MQIRDFALQVLTSPEVERKLQPPPAGLVDEVRDGEAPPRAPARSDDLQIVPIRKAQVPSLEGWHDPHQRRRILHALANHEMQAAELFAWALLEFSEAPDGFRRGLFAILQDEQRHTRMYIGRLEAVGGQFGQFPVSGHFWNKVDGLVSPSAFVCAMSLTFENANIDHTLEIAEAARASGDEKSALLVEAVHRDELEHVRFGWHWLEQLKAPDQSMWEAYEEGLGRGLHPGRASGRHFTHDGRRTVGMSEDFIARLEAAWGATDSGGRRRG